MSMPLIPFTRTSVAVAEDDQVITEDARLDRRAVGLLDLFGQTHRYPVPTHQSAHWRIAFDTAQQVVFFTGEHGVLAFPAAAGGRALAKSLVV